MWKSAWRLLIDAIYVYRVLQNLAGNATRVMPKHQIIISVGKKKRPLDQCGGWWTGYSRKDRERVFTSRLPRPWMTVVPVRLGGYESSLSIVSRIAFWFNGRMSVDESPTLGGARFIDFAGAPVSVKYWSRWIDPKSSEKNTQRWIKTGNACNLAKLNFGSNSMDIANLRPSINR